WPAERASWDTRYLRYRVLASPTAAHRFRLVASDIRAGGHPGRYPRQAARRYRRHRGHVTEYPPGYPTPGHPPPYPPHGQSDHVAPPYGLSDHAVPPAEAAPYG